MSFGPDVMRVLLLMEGLTVVSCGIMFDHLCFVIYSLDIRWAVFLKELFHISQT